MAATLSALQTCPAAARGAGAASRRTPAAAAAQPARAAGHAESRALAARQAFSSVAGNCQALSQGPSMRRRVLAQAQSSGAVVVSASAQSAFVKFSDITTNLFPVWTVIAALVGLYNPGLFAAIDTKYFTAMLAALSASHIPRGSPRVLHFPLSRAGSRLGGCRRRAGRA